MDMKRMADMAERIAQPTGGEDNPALSQIDEAIDKMLVSIKAIEEQLPNVETASKAEEDAKAKIKDLFETAINPYVADVLEALDVFVGEE